MGIGCILKHFMEKDHCASLPCLTPEFYTGKKDISNLLKSLYFIFCFVVIIVVVTGN